MAAADETKVPPEPSAGFALVGAVRARSSSNRTGLSSAQLSSALSADACSAHLRACAVSPRPSASRPCRTRRRALSVFVERGDRALAAPLTFADGDAPG